MSTSTLAKDNELDLDLLQYHLDERNVIKHPSKGLPISIYTYSQKVQYERLWDPVTTMCRGLVLKDEGLGFVARPLRKFFNYTDPLANILDKNKTFNIYEKLDGVSILLSWFEYKWILTTKTSFNNEYVVKAHQLLAARGFNFNDPNALDNVYTYIFELISPAHKIIVDYGPNPNLVLIAVKHVKLGYEINELSNMIKRYPNIFTPDNIAVPLKKGELVEANTATLAELEKMNLPNKEGYVINWLYDRHRVKIKFPDYEAKHKTKYKLTNLQVWRAVATANFRLPIQTDYPIHQDYLDIFYTHCKKYQDRFLELEKQYQDKFTAILSEATAGYTKPLTKKTFAEAVQVLPNKHIYFKILNEKEYDYALWQEVKPHTVENIC